MYCMSALNYLVYLQSGASIRVVNQLLTEMDGLESRRQVFIMAATNRPGNVPDFVKPVGEKNVLLADCMASP